MSNRHRQARRHKAALKRIPVCGPLRDEFSIVLHTSLWCLDNQPTADAFNNLSHIFNVVGLALEYDSRHQSEAQAIAAGATMLNQVMTKIDAGQPLTAEESAPIRAAINTMDGLLGRMNISDLYAAMRRLQDFDDASEREAA